MFECLKIFTGKLLEMISVSKIIEYQKNEKRSTISADLFMLYMSLNKIYVNGLEIVRELQSGIQWMERKHKDKEVEAKLSTDLPRMLQRQKQELSNFIKLFNRLNAVLSVLDKDSYEKYVV